jgi:transposase
MSYLTSDRSGLTLKLELTTGDISVENQEQILTSFQRKQLEHKLKQQDIPKLLRQRIAIMLLADEGKTQGEICQTLGCSAATANRWILFARAQFAHQWQDSPPGRPKKVSDEYLQRLQALIQSDPRDYGYPFQRWTANWLNKHLNKELGIDLSDRHLSRLLKKLGLSTCAREPSDEETETVSHQASKLHAYHPNQNSKVELRDGASASVTPLRNRFTPPLSMLSLKGEF